MIKGGAACAVPLFLSHPVSLNPFGLLENIHFAFELRNLITDLPHEILPEELPARLFVQEFGLQFFAGQG